jgi:hypothetical protein
LRQLAAVQLEVQRSHELHSHNRLRAGLKRRERESTYIDVWSKKGAMFSRAGGGEPLSPGSMALAALSAGGMGKAKAAGGGEESSKSYRKRSSVAAAAAGSRFARMGSHLPSMSAVHSADRSDPATGSSSSSSRVPTGLQPRGKPMVSSLNRQASAMSSASERDEVPAVGAAQLAALIGAQIEKLLPRGTSMGGTRTEVSNLFK